MTESRFLIYLLGVLMVLLTLGAVALMALHIEVQPWYSGLLVTAMGGLLGVIRGADTGPTPPPADMSEDGKPKPAPKV